MLMKPPKRLFKHQGQRPDPNDEWARILVDEMCESGMLREGVAITEERLPDYLFWFGRFFARHVIDTRPHGSGVFEFHARGDGGNDVLLCTVEFDDDRNAIVTYPDGVVVWIASEALSEPEDN
jgi:hypothetical protein